MLVLDEKNCSDPGGPLNGYRRVVEDTGLLNGRYAKIGTVIAFFCNNSYVLSGNEQRTCQDNGEWSGKQPICIKGSLQYFLSQLTKAAMILLDFFKCNLHSPNNHFLLKINRLTPHRENGSLPALLAAKLRQRRCQ